MEPLARTQSERLRRLALAGGIRLSAGVMINSLSWIANTSGGQAGGGFLSTHPATEERIQALRRMQ